MWLEWKGYLKSDRPELKNVVLPLTISVVLRYSLISRGLSLLFSKLGVMVLKEVKYDTQCTSQLATTLITLTLTLCSGGRTVINSVGYF